MIGGDKQSLTAHPSQKTVLFIIYAFQRKLEIDWEHEGKLDLSDVFSEWQATSPGERSNNVWGKVKQKGVKNHVTV